MERSFVLWLYGVPPPLRLFAVAFLLLVRLSISTNSRPPCAPVCVHSNITPRVPAVPVPPASPPSPAAECDNLTSDPSQLKRSSLRYSRDELLAANTTGARLDTTVVARLKELSIGVNLPRKRSCRGGTRKRRRIQAVCGTPDGDPPAVHGPVPPSILSDITSLPPRPQGANFSNLITVPLQRTKTLPNHLCMCVFNAQSVGPSIKRSAIRDFIHEHDIDVFLMTETWLRKSGDEAKLSDLTPPGYKLLSFPRQQTSKIKRGGGLAVILKDFLAENCSTTTIFPFDHVSFELAQLTLTIHERRITFFLVYRTPPNQKNKLTTPLFFTELTDFLDYCLHCQNRIVISGDFNFHVDDAADTNAKKLLEQLDMYNLKQTVTEPTQRCRHILDLVIHRNDDDIVHSTSLCHDLASNHYAILNHLTTPSKVCFHPFQCKSRSW